MKGNWIGIFVLTLMLCACGNTNNLSEEQKSNDPTQSLSTFQPKIKYAQHFTIGSYKNFKSLIVNNPWKEKDTLVSYLFYPKGAVAPQADWAEFVIPTPVDKIVATSSPHIGFLGLIGELDRITGVAEDRYLFNQHVLDKVRMGKIARVGSLKNSNLEVLLDLSPDILMKTGMDNVRNEDARLTEAGIPISYNVEWMEGSMLARAEWMKFVAAFFDKDREADSIFRHIEKAYLEALKLVENVDYRPAIMTGNNFKGTWYMPGADSYLAKLIQEAGGDYRFKNEKSKGSLPLSFEVVLDELMDADYWIGPRAASLKELEMMDERYALFKAFRTGNVYTFNKRTRENGGNDYWESGITRPDLIIKDVIKIFHPELLPGHELYYYKKLQ